MKRAGLDKLQWVRKNSQVHVHGKLDLLKGLTGRSHCDTLQLGYEVPVPYSPMLISYSERNLGGT